MRLYSLLAVCFIALGISKTATPQSFDCYKADSTVERLICLVPDLREKDDKLATLYNQHLKKHPRQSDTIRKAQNTWWRRRQECASQGNRMQPCVEEAYAARIRELSPPSDRDVDTAIIAPSPQQPQAPVPSPPPIRSTHAKSPRYLPSDAPYFINRSIVPACLDVDVMVMLNGGDAMTLGTPARTLEARAHGRCVDLPYGTQVVVSEIAKGVAYVLPIGSNARLPGLFVPACAVQSPNGTKVDSFGEFNAQGYGNPKSRLLPKCD